jgi:nanoRNase/pAp phosphatase (c-di-AMP/oligoRNAs hydrolase)
MKDRIERLKACLKDFGKERVPTAAILLGDADPDSMGAGMGMQALLASLGWGKIDLIHDGEVSLEQNKTVLNVLGLRLLNRHEAIRGSEKSFAECYDHFVFVDCSPRGKLDKKLNTILIVDHHSCDVLNPSCICDIRVNVGSACAMVWEYMKEAEVVFNVDNEHSQDIATGMFFGIQNDTQSFTSENTSDLDITAYADLAKFIDRQKLSRIIDFDLSTASFEIRKQMDLDGNNLKKDSCFIGFAGVVPDSQRHHLAVLATERARQEGVRTAIVFGIVGNHIQVNVRSSNDAVNVDMLCKKVFGDDYGGGKPGAGRARFPLGILSFDDIDDPAVIERVSIAYRDILMPKLLRLAQG